MQLVGYSKKMGEQDFTRSTHLQCIHSKLLTWNIVASTFSYNNRGSFQKQMVRVQIGLPTRPLTSKAKISKAISFMTTSFMTISFKKYYPFQ